MRINKQEVEALQAWADAASTTFVYTGPWQTTDGAEEYYIVAPGDNGEWAYRELIVRRDYLEKSQDADFVIVCDDESEIEYVQAIVQAMRDESLRSAAIANEVTAAYDSAAASVGDPQYQADDIAFNVHINDSNSIAALDPVINPVCRGVWHAAMKAARAPLLTRINEANERYDNAVAAHAEAMRVANASMEAQAMRLVELQSDNVMLANVNAESARLLKSMGPSSGRDVNTLVANLERLTAEVQTGAIPVTNTAEGETTVVDKEDDGSNKPYSVKSNKYGTYVINGSGARVSGNITSDGAKALAAQLNAKTPPAVAG